MCKICPKCGAIAEYNAYYGRTICTRCRWESKEVTLCKKDPKIHKQTFRVSIFSRKYAKI